MADGIGLTNELARAESAMSRLQARASEGQPVGWTRRQALGGLSFSMLGLGLPELLRLQAHASQPRLERNEFRYKSRPARAKACIFIFLGGGASHIDIWDMKPEAPAEIRGEF